ncbi:M48 family metallopeptidase, partial [Pseudobutyrivibrio sp.]|uniref:M48 family metallopeptidase n=1 Tax=Pseudobutyrivibrio sp. TaxID=2014367 RepID=UPI0025D16DC0
SLSSDDSCSHYDCLYALSSDSIINTENLSIMQAKDIMHPEDAKALQILKKLRGFDDLIRVMMENGYEKQYRGDNLGCYLKVSDSNYKDIYQLFKGVVRQVGIKMPELYIYNDPVMNAYTYGETNTFVAISSSLIERLSIDELRSVMAHECGHILCHHTLYNTLLRTIEELGTLLQIISYSALGPILMAMQYWSRKSELSADRCEAAVVGDEVYQRTLLKMTCGLSKIEGSPYQLVEQAREYHQMKHESWWDVIQQNCRIAFNSHPQSCERALEIDRWKHSWQYRKLRSNLSH